MDVDGTELARFVVLGSALGAVVATDLAGHRIPNRIVVPAAIACAGLLAAQALRPQQLLGGLAVVALMLGMSLVSPPSFGMGDVKLAPLLVLGLGELATQALILGLVLAAAFGAVLVIVVPRSSRCAVSSPSAVLEQRRGGGGSCPQPEVRTHT